MHPGIFFGVCQFRLAYYFMHLGLYFYVYLLSSRLTFRLPELCYHSDKVPRECIEKISSWLNTNQSPNYTVMYKWDISMY